MHLARSLVLHAVLGAGAPLAVAVVGCTGQVTTVPDKGDDTRDAASPDALPGPDASPAPDASSGCPATAPAPGSSCTIEDLQCEYGQSEYPGCDKIVQCSSGAWGGLLGPPSLCPGPNPAGCPATMADATGSCQPGSGGFAFSCYYATGGCYCGSLGGPVGVEPDGAVAPADWQCDNPGPGCPLPRPRIGTACTLEGTMCNYLECNFAQTCMGGVWMDQETGCAVAGAGP
jgi:hypothetical protein